MPTKRTALAALALALAACASNAPTSSGLLGDTSSFKARGEGGYAQVLATPEELGRYKRVRIDRVLVFLAPDSAGLELAQETRRNMAGLLQQALRAEIGAHYELVGDRGVLDEDVLRIRAALTDLYPAGAEVEGEIVDLSSAQVELEVLDGPTGGRLAAAIARKVATRPTSTPEENRAEAERAFAEWALALREWLDEVTGR